ncbi:hypothetical protein LCGC14_1087900 [marine sediment metagenome]|uniref:Uncharacterized protein n=1 Tax=marine sediment metagenome TaxID=412755 RepID=A0A0F9PWG9_9ZZZZ
MDTSLIDWNKFLPGNIKKIVICRKDLFAEVANISNVNVDYKGRIIIKEGKNVGGNYPTILYEVSLEEEQKLNLWKMYEINDGIRDVPRVLRATIGIDYNDDTFISYPCMVEVIPDLLVGTYTGFGNKAKLGIVKVTVSIKDTPYASAISVQDLVKKVSKKYIASKENKERIKKEIEERREKARIEAERIKIEKEKDLIAEELMFLRKSTFLAIADLVQEVKDIENTYNIYDLMDLEDDY